MKPGSGFDGGRALITACRNAKGYRQLAARVAAVLPRRRPSQTPPYCGHSTSLGAGGRPSRRQTLLAATGITDESAASTEGRTQRYKLAEPVAAGDHGLGEGDAI